MSSAADDPRSRPPAAGAGLATTDNPVPFYWQLPKEEQERLRAGNVILEDEGYLAHEINRGRWLLDVSDHYEPLPDVPSDWTSPEPPERFSDAVAAILQVAHELGHDPVAVCDAALMTQRSVLASSTASIRRTPAPTRA